MRMGEGEHCGVDSGYEREGGEGIMSRILKREQDTRDREGRLLGKELVLEEEAEGEDEGEDGDNISFGYGVSYITGSTWRGEIHPLSIYDFTTSNKLPFHTQLERSPPE